MAIIVERIISGVRRRIRQLETELRLLEQQLEFITKIPGFDKDEATVLSLEHNIYVILHKNYCAYLDTFCERASIRYPLKKIIEVHLECLNEMQLTSFMEEVFGHQCAIQMITGVSIETAGDTPEHILKAVSNMLPFNLIVPILHDERFLDVLFRTVEGYKPTEHKKWLLNLWNPLMALKLDKYVIVALSEIFLSFFVEDEIENSFRDLNEVYSCVVNSRMLISRGLSAFELPPCVSELKVNKEIEPEEKPLYSLSEWKSHWPSEAVEKKVQKAMLPGLRHIALELRKCETQISVSTAVYKLWRAFDWLTKALAQEGDMVGADESFTFYVLELCEADMTRLPMILGAMEKFVIEEFKISKVAYLLTQTRIAVDWIVKQDMEAQRDVVLMPMRTFGETEALSRQKILLSGFKLYTIPLFRDATVRPFPYFTGQTDDVVTLYEYDVASKDDTFKDWQFLKTPQGYVMVLEPTRIHEWNMIEVVNGSYDVSEPMIEAVSNFMVLLPMKLSNPKTAPLTRLTRIYSETWHVEPSQVDRDMQDRILAMKQALIRYGAIQTDSDGTITGIVDHQMVLAVKSIFKYVESDTDFFVNQEIYDAILNLKKPWFKFW